MKILQVHHRYSSRMPSGEDWVVDAEAWALQQAGHEVVGVTRLWDHFSTSLQGLANAAIRSVWNPGAVRQVAAACDEHHPDVVHFHNTFPTFSPGAFWSAHRRAPVVFTVHNYRAFCAAAVASRDDKPCFECLEKRSVAPALIHGCYRRSHVSTLAPALMIATHRALRTWTRNIDAFVALSRYQRDRLVGAGWPQDRIHVKPNLIRDPGTLVPWQEREPRVVFAGRLSPEKGAAVLIEAWHRWGDGAPQLRIVGAGPQLDALKQLARGGPAGSRIEFVGQLDGPSVSGEIGRARLVVVPSVCEETFSLVVGQAFAAGTPVAASDSGALRELVRDGDTGIRFRMGDASALQRAVAALWEGPGMGALGASARRDFEARFAVAPVLAQLLDIYRVAMEARAREEARHGVEESRSA